MIRRRYEGSGAWAAPGAVDHNSLLAGGSARPRYLHGPMSRLGLQEGYAPEHRPAAGLIPPARALLCQGASARRWLRCDRASGRRQSVRHMSGLPELDRSRTGEPRRPAASRPPRGAPRRCWRFAVPLALIVAIVCQSRHWHRGSGRSEHRCRRADSQGEGGLRVVEPAVDAKRREHRILEHPQRIAIGEVVVVSQQCGVIPVRILVAG